MNNNNELEIWKRKLAELEGKIKQFNNHKFILINIFNELKAKTNIKLNDSLRYVGLQEEIYHLEDWIGFYNGKIASYKNRIDLVVKKAGRDEKTETNVDEENIREQVKELFSDKFAEKKTIIKPKLKEIKTELRTVIKKPKFKDTVAAVKRPKKNIWEYVTKLHKSKLVRYGLPVIISLLIISILFISKPEITGYVVRTEEKTYDDNLNLVINESGTYEWKPQNPGVIKSIEATGSAEGNGTVKVYIEKDGVRYLIYEKK